MNISTQQGRRRLVVAGAGLLYLSGLVAVLVSFHLDLYRLRQAGWLGVAVTFGALMMLSLWTGRVATRPDGEVDERQRALRDRAYRLSYQWLGGIMAAFYGYLLVGKNGAFWVPREPAEFVSTFLVVFATLFSGLPSAVLAWIEPEPPGE